MTMSNNIIEHNAITHETVIREMTASELAQRQIDVAIAADKSQAAADLIAARASALAKLTDLGLTETEIKALVGQ